MEPLPKTKPNASFARPEESREIVRKLLATRLFAKYERSFSAASGLPLSIRPLESFQMPACRNKKENPFCALMARSRKGCVACLQTQSELENGAQYRTRTLRCYANLHDSMVPVKIGQKVVAYLQTGQVALKPFSASDFDHTHSELILKGIDVDAREARKAFFQSRVMSKDEYHGFLKMLEIFAESLGHAANALLLERTDRRESALVSKSVQFLDKRFDRKITLAEIAKVAGASERHFCKVFKKETGLTFVAYLSRKRVEVAKKSLRESARHVSEIAFEVGFESIAQFNRAFKAIAGESPSAYRKAAMN